MATYSTKTKVLVLLFTFWGLFPQIALTASPPPPPAEFAQFGKHAQFAQTLTSKGLLTGASLIPLLQEAGFFPTSSAKNLCTRSSSFQNGAESEQVIYIHLCDTETKSEKAFVFKNYGACNSDDSYCPEIELNKLLDLKKSPLGDESLMKIKGFPTINHILKAFFYEDIFHKKNYVGIFPYAQGEPLFDIIHDHFFVNKKGINALEMEKIMKNTGLALGVFHHSLAAPRTEKEKTAKQEVFFPTITHNDCHIANLIYNRHNHQLTLIDNASITPAQHRSNEGDLYFFYMYTKYSCLFTQSTNKAIHGQVNLLFDSFAQGYAQAYPETQQALAYKTIISTFKAYSAHIVTNYKLKGSKSIEYDRTGLENDPQYKIRTPWNYFVYVHRRHKTPFAFEQCVYLDLWGHPPADSTNSACAPDQKHQTKTEQGK